MTKIVITKTSSDYWYKIKTFPNLESVLTFCRQKGQLVLKKNWHYKDDPKEIIKFWDGMTLADAKEVSECEFELEIYDDYRE